MSHAKPLNSYTRSGKPNIAMPAEGEISPIERLTNPNIQSQEVQSSEDNVVFNSVPDQAPQDESESYQDEPEQQEEQLDYNEPQEIKSSSESDRSVKSKSSSENFKELRLARERAEKKAEQQEALIAHLLAQQQAMQNKPQVQQKIKESDFDDILSSVDDDAFMEGKDYKKFAKITKQKVDETARELAEYKRQIADMAAESRVRAKCPDLDQVVTEENIYLLRERHPDIAAALNAAPDSWDKYSSVYTMIKSLGIHKTRAYDYDKNVAILNSKKPKPAASLSPQQGDSPLSGVNAFIVDRKMSKEGAAQTWKEMQAAMKKS